jgi:hypothetical protein
VRAARRVTHHAFVYYSQTARSRVPRESRVLGDASVADQVRKSLSGVGDFSLRTDPVQQCRYVGRAGIASRRRTMKASGNYLPRSLEVEITPFSGIP